MKSKYFYLFMLIAFIILSCSSINDPAENKIILEPLEKSLKITNLGSRTIYLLVVEAEVATLINWAPHFGNPHIHQFGSITLEYSHIINGSDETVKPGDDIIVYYWDDSNKSNPEINVDLITL